MQPKGGTNAFELNDSQVLARLDSWKEIAAYLGRDERTVRRWEKSEGLPIHRHLHQKRGTVYAYASELDRWRNSRRPELDAEHSLAPVITLEGKERSGAPVAAVVSIASALRWKLVLPVAGVMLLLGWSALTWVRQQVPTLKVARYSRITNDGHDKSGNISIGIPSPIVTDGTRLYFVEPKTQAGPSGVVQVSTSGGDTIAIPVPLQNARLTDISPDRTHLLVGNIEGPTAVEVPFYSVPTAGGSAQRLGDFLAHDASWSPNGLSLAYATGDALYVARSDGSAAKRLVSGLGAVWWPRWSPDGARLRFTVTQPKTQDNAIWEITADGNHLRDLSREWNLSGSECCGSWTLGGEYFVFQSSQWDLSTIWVVRERNLPFAKARPVQLTSGPIWASAPLASEDGKKLSFVGSQASVEPIRYHRQRKQFVSLFPTASISGDGFNFTRDGKWITYMQYPEGTLWRARSDGTERLQLTSGPLRTFRPRWSPDGERIAFFGAYPHSPLKIYVLSEKGGAPEQLVPGDSNEGDPTWSPDGRKLVFGRLPWMPSAPEKPLIYILDLTSKQVTVLPGSEGLFSPRWSPSGRYIAALSADSSRLMLCDLETSKWRQLAQGMLGNPEWSHDNAYVYALNAQTTEVVRIRISDGRIEPVVNLSTERIAWTGLGPWTGLTPDDSVLAARDLSTQEIYALELKTH